MIRILLVLLFVSAVNTRAETGCDHAFEEKLPIGVDLTKMEARYCGTVSSIAEATGGEVIVVYELYERAYLADVVRYKIGIESGGETVFYHESARILTRENVFEQFDLRKKRCFRKFYFGKCSSWQKLGSEEMMRRHSMLTTIIARDYLIKKFSGAFMIYPLFHEGGFLLEKL